MNGEVFFRTGCAIQPTINLGFYIPIGQEDIKPYLAIGPGFSVGSNNVKLSFNGGLTLGQETVIKDRYKNVDLNTIEGYTDANATTLVWKNSWYVGFGVSYNLSN
jgi:opacity protein-like surface antigen